MAWQTQLEHLICTLEGDDGTGVSEYTSLNDFKYDMGSYTGAGTCSEASKLAESTRNRLADMSENELIRRINFFLGTRAAVCECGRADIIDGREDVMDGRADMSGADKSNMLSSASPIGSKTENPARARVADSVGNTCSREEKHE